MLVWQTTLHLMNLGPWQNVSTMLNFTVVAFDTFPATSFATLAAIVTVFSPSSPWIFPKVSVNSLRISNERQMSGS